MKVSQSAGEPAELQSLPDADRHKQVLETNLRKLILTENRELACTLCSHLFLPSFYFSTEQI